MTIRHRDDWHSNATVFDVVSIIGWRGISAHDRLNAPQYQPALGAAEKRSAPRLGRDLGSQLPVQT
jgi:hypothetical protein